MAHTKHDRNQGEGDRRADEHYREEVRRFLRSHDPDRIARRAARELDEEEPRPSERPNPHHH
jgi:hypothetical protein